LCKYKAMESGLEVCDLECEVGECVRVTEDSCDRTGEVQIRSGGSAAGKMGKRWYWTSRGLCFFVWKQEQKHHLET
jgi:hypothetical protein